MMDYGGGEVTWHNCPIYVIVESLEHVKDCPEIYVDCLWRFDVSPSGEIIFGALHEINHAGMLLRQLPRGHIHFLRTCVTPFDLDGELPGWSFGPSRQAAERAVKDYMETFLKRGSEQPTVPSNEWFTYFIQAGHRGPIKIGKTQSHPARRLRSLQTGCHETLHLRAYITGDYEENFHRHFGHLRIRGEWFKSTPTLCHSIYPFVYEYSVPEVGYPDPGIERSPILTPFSKNAILMEKPGAD